MEQLLCHAGRRTRKSFTRLELLHPGRCDRTHIARRCQKPVVACCVNQIEAGPLDPHNLRARLAAAVGEEAL
jgi:hypothetical protein